MHVPDGFLDVPTSAATPSSPQPALPWRCEGRDESWTSARLRSRG